ncbi:hypothetical protein D3C79_677510 [compost metagenome]
MQQQAIRRHRQWLVIAPTRHITHRQPQQRHCLQLPFKRTGHTGEHIGTKRKPYQGYWQLRQLPAEVTDDRDAVLRFADALVVRALCLPYPTKTRPHHLPTGCAQLPRQGQRHDMARAPAQQRLWVTDQHHPLWRPGRVVDQQFDLAGRSIDKQLVT